MMLASATSTESIHLQPSTILQLSSHHARQQPDQPALQGNDISLSYAELELRIDVLSQWLQAQHCSIPVFEGYGLSECGSVVALNTPPSGHISIAIQQRLGQVCFCVCDTGPGIAPHERDKVLQRFYRLADQTISGSGLGLSIAQQIVDQQGASLTLADLDGGSSGLTVRVCFGQAQ